MTDILPNLSKKNFGLKLTFRTISRKIVCTKWWYGKSYNCPWASLAYSVNTRSPLESTNPNPPWVCPFGASSSLISNDFEFSLVKYCEKNETEWLSAHNSKLQNNEVIN